jgi:hypothetical protein
MEGPMRAGRALRPKARTPLVVRLARTAPLTIGEAITLVVLWATLLGISAGHDIPLTTVIGVFATVSFATVGGFLVSRLSGHRVGWLLWSSGVLLAIDLGAGYLASEGLTVAPGSIPDAISFAWLSNWIGAPGLLLAAGILPLYFPTGRSLTSRWRLVAIVGLSLIGIDVLAGVFGQFKAGTYPTGVTNPLAIGGSLGGLLAFAGNLADGIFGFVIFPLAVTSLIVRYERSNGIERQQLRPFGILSGIAVGALFLAFAGMGEFAWLIADGALALLPVTIGIAVLRYQLYDIDRLISRTIAYGALTAIVAGLFIGSTLGFQAVLAPLTRSNELAVAGSTLLVAALFQPIRRRIQRLVDRRFNRTRYDAERTVAAFAARLRDEVDLEQLRAEILATVRQAVEPSSVSLWLRE